MGHDGDSEFAHPPSTIAPGPLVPVVSVSPSPGGLPAVPELSVDNLTVLVVVTLGLSVVLALSVVLLALRLRGIRRTYARLLGGGGRNEDLLAAVTRHVAAVERLHGRVDQLGRQSAEYRQRISGLIRTVGFARYDAFPDMAGQLSYSVALLDEAGDGIVLSAIDMALGRPKQVTIRV